MRFRNLDVWKGSARLAADIYKELAGLKDYGFKDQITRSALSIPSNIAEGEERDAVNDNIRFLNIAKGSAAELLTQTYIGIEIKYIPPAVGKLWINETQKISKQLGALIRSKKSKLIRG